MRRLLPPPDPTTAASELLDVDLLREYAYPTDGSWLRANMVASIDGVASLDGVSEGLSGPADKRVFGLLRVLADVIIAGAGTVRAEGYRGADVAERFTEVRARAGQPPNPTIAIVSRRLGLDPTTDVFVETTVRPIVLTCAAADRESRARLSEVADVIVVGDADVDPVEARLALEDLGLNRMLCEGGPSLLHDMLGADVIDELCLTTSPMLVGGGERHLLHPAPLLHPRTARLVGMVEDDGVLLSRYRIDRPTHPR